MPVTQVTPPNGKPAPAPSAAVSSSARSTVGLPFPATALALPPHAFERLREAIPKVADEAVDTIMREVPSYAGPFSEPMGDRIRTAVQLALFNFLELARVGGGSDPAEPIAPSTAAAYDLGRGEARSGRSMDALLTAFRVGARVSWRGLSREAVGLGVQAPALGAFAELVFAYMDALSGASVAGHADELSTAGRARERYRERLAGLLVAGADEAELASAARRAEWVPPRTLTAVMLPDDQQAGVLGALDARALSVTVDAGEEEDSGFAVLFVPDAGPRERERLLRQLDGRAAVVGPERHWSQVRSSYLRAARARMVLPRPPRRGVIDTEEHLPALLLAADPQLSADLRARCLAPLDGLRPTVRARLEETLRSWLLHHGRRDLIAAQLYVHPQTVRYRMGQLRELFGERLADPEQVLGLTLALAHLPTTAPVGDGDAGG